MDAVRTFLSRLWHDDSGQALTEYALIIALIAVVVVGAILLLGTDIAGLFNSVANCVKSGAAATTGTGGTCP